MEESNAWRHPIDLVSILERAFAELPDALPEGRRPDRRGGEPDDLAQRILADDPQVIVDALRDGLRRGASGADLAGAVAQAAALRIARFHTSNEFGDWDRALHTFTFAHAVRQGMRRAPSVELLRGVFDAAMSVYLDRFLNVPAARVPEPRAEPSQAALALAELPSIFDRQQQVDEAGAAVASCLGGGGDDRLLAVLGGLLLREDRDFHTIQCVEAAFRQHELLRGTPGAAHALIAAARYLAAHAPTPRAQGQTYQIARRLHRGERLHEGEE
jgi:hypothetical protein